MKTINKKEIMILIALLIATIIWALIYKNIEAKKIFEAKYEIQQKEIESLKITDQEKNILKINSENKKTKKAIIKINSEIKILDEDKNEKESYEKCLKNQLIRIWEWKEVKKDYCLDDNAQIEAKSDLIVLESAWSKVLDRIQVKSNLEALKSNLFICKEVKNEFWLKSDEFRCATYMTMVKSFESNHWKSNYCKNYNNCFWLKNPTDKKWLKWNVSVWNNRFLKFETQEMWNFAFAYYYQKYHTPKNATQFVNSYSDWNKNYIYFLINNYDDLYSQYKNILK